MFIWILAIGLTVLLLGISAWTHSDAIGTMAASLTQKDKDTRPVLWWYVDDVESNARQWLDFGNRDSRAANEPYLEVCWKRAQELWGQAFRLERITGRKELMRLLGSSSSSSSSSRAILAAWPTVDTCPPALWMPWCRATVLSTQGGLWMDGSVLPFAGTGPSLQSRVQPHSILAFGVDPDAGAGDAAAGTAAPGRSAGWARAPEDPTWTAQARALTDQVVAGPSAWTAFETDRILQWLWSQSHTGKHMPIDRSAEISRDRCGRRLELETLLTESVWPGGDETRGEWVPWPRGRDELTRASPYGWFLRSSAAQIQEGSYVWSQWSHPTNTKERP